MAKRKVMLVDDQPSYRNVMKTILGTIKDVEIVGEAVDGEDFLAQLPTLRPEIVFMDIEMPVMNGIIATQKALQRYPQMIIIGLSMYENQNYVDLLIKAGAKGYLLKLSDNYKHFEAIIKRATEELVFSDQIKKQQNKNTKTRKPLILIIDDLETNTFVVSFALENAGYKVIKASGLGEGLNYLGTNNEEIDLIISEFNLPDMTAAEFIKRARTLKDYQLIPMIILSSSKNQNDKDAAKEAGITKWLAKPFHLPTFLKTIEEALQQIS